MPKYRITFTGGPIGKRSRSYDVDAKDVDEAFCIAYKMPEATSRMKYSDINVTEIQDGPKVIGVCFTYTQAGHSYSQYLFIRAENEEQAKRYYRKNIQGKRFWQPQPGKPDENGNCVYGNIRETYFACASGYDFDALTDM